MTTAQVGFSFPRDAAVGGRYDRAGAIRAGKWTFTPGSPAAAGGGRASLRHGAERVDLFYSSTTLEDFLRTLGRIQAEFHAAQPAAAHTDFAEQARDV
ncbi:hypothetical protein [Streptomyces sp. NPDC015131]|uniref:hypothetical protein n=1 Tax=Streptomyces sp. NPDC015131 TaxID=3364941 RepID=UPI0036FB2CB6